MANVYIQTLYRATTPQKPTEPFSARNNRTVHETNRTVQDSETNRTVHETIGFVQEAYPNVQEAFRTVQERTETFMNFFELISQTTPPKKCHRLFKI